MRTTSGKVTAAGALALLLCTATAGAGIGVAVTLGGALDRAIASAGVLRSHMHADMMHDALRGDVMSVAESFPGTPPGTTVTGWSATTRDADRLLRDVGQLQQLDLPAPVVVALASLRGDQRAYADLAVRLVDAAREGRAPRPEQLEDFQHRFQRLRAPQEAVTTTLTLTSNQVVGAQTQNERVIAAVLLTASSLALAGWTLLLALHRRARRRLDDALGREAEQRAVADQLQQSLLPSRLPSIPGLKLAARSQPGDPSRQVGGDWYDVFSLPSGKVGLVVGDVVGHDLSAAAAMTQIRSTLRSVAAFESSPGAVLDRVNDIAAIYELTELTTCVYAVVDPATGWVTWASAGHLNPLMVVDTGDAMLLDGDPGPPLGVSVAAVYTDRSCRVQPGGSLLFFTDGLVERSSCSIDDGLAMLATVRGPHQEPEQLCEQVLALLAGLPPTDDDVTLLALRADDTADHPVLV